MNTTALVISIVAFILSVWSVVGIISISKTLNVILDIFKLQKMQDDIKNGKGSPSEHLKELEKMCNERH